MKQEVIIGMLHPPLGDEQMDVTARMDASASLLQVQVHGLCGGRAVRRTRQHCNVTQCLRHSLCVLTIHQLSSLLLYNPYSTLLCSDYDKGCVLSCCGCLVVQLVSSLACTHSSQLVDGS